MKVLIDENLPHDFRLAITGHDALTVQYLGWCGLKNGLLLSRAASAGFDVMIKMDSNVQYQQNPAVLPVAIVVLRAASNDLADLQPLVPRLLEVLATVQPRSIVVIE